MTTETMARAEALLQRLVLENAQLRKENRTLRKLKVNAGQGRILNRAMADATALLAWRFAGYSISRVKARELGTVSYTHLRAHETVLDLVCRLLLEKKKNVTL